ncbi:hypothetical protein QFZ79_001368 [Arthrobacter sp. V4I6]|uniref:hypothetical protein n=1 Tax=unclassified Arthrobacter TaxID=235627 RepID=UPI002783AB0D|nr:MULTISPECIES: hypothetical protein [unclassified Arthrobacter]MDQ0823623.1 hypothetical protein [Arthrobacter sp. V1I7]MDQ0853257.1 hypothetical protein [Arthrobacter sp. V4I6]
MKPPGDIWRTDPATLRDVVLDRAVMEDRLTQCPALERVWILCLLDRPQEAITEGQDLLAGAADRFRPLLVLAQAYQRQYSWHEATRLHEEALRLARTPAGKLWSAVRSAGGSSMKPGTGKLPRSLNGPGTSIAAPANASISHRHASRPSTEPGN